MDEVVQAGEKHKKTALDLKVVAENLKRKVSANRERESKLMDDIDNLEIEVRKEHEFNMQLAKERSNFVMEAKLLLENLEVKTEEKNKLEFLMSKQQELSSNVIKRIHYAPPCRREIVQ